MRSRYSTVGRIAVLFAICICAARHGDAAASPAAALRASSLVAAAVEPPVVTDPKDQAILRKFLEHAHNEARTITKEAVLKQQTPEMFCWLDMKTLAMSLTAYELTGDADHLRDFVWGFENLRSIMARDADGYWGWRGLAIKGNRNPDKPDTIINDIQTSFRAVGVMARFVELIDADPALRQEFAEQRAAYLDLIDNHLVKKWHERGSYVDLGARGAIYRNNPAYVARRADITLPYEKTSIMVEGLLNAYRATGNALYFRRAIKLGTRLKHCLTLADGRYGWHYWDPMGKWDVNKQDPTKWGHWIGIEPNPSWHAVTVGIAAQLYHHGVVFTRTDMERFLKTQMEVCWNGDEADPEFFYTNGAPAKGNARMIAPSLAPFSEKLAAFLYTGALQEERVAKSDSAWQGGILADGWLRMKYIVLPRAKGGRRMHLGCRDEFLKSAENREFLAALEFEVAEPGYQTPMTPAEMDPMPEAPPTAIR